MPWNTINTEDTFNRLVIWRAPELASEFKAKYIAVDLHDTIQPERLEKVKDLVDTFFVKSAYHRSLYPDYLSTKANFKIVGNGIKRSQF